MKRWFDSGIRYPHTLIVHGFLLSTACFTLDDYPDVILWVGGLMLTVHLIYAISLVRKGTPPLPIGICAAVGTVTQISVLNWSSKMNGLASGLGSGFGLFFYQVMLAFFWFLLVIALSIAYFTRKKAE
ncbi:MAG: hypothetical protein IKC09_10480 [Oscillospiraceae bacterium]|nr:hypothetical protein [Oscillospiraceae bacterium]MBR2890687.1 hypothetical protein [Oscillospiraceae bacterium]